MKHRKFWGIVIGIILLSWMIFASYKLFIIKNASVWETIVAIAFSIFIIVTIIAILFDLLSRKFEIFNKINKFWIKGGKEIIRGLRLGR